MNSSRPNSAIPEIDLHGINICFKVYCLQAYYQSLCNVWKLENTVKSDAIFQKPVIIQKKENLHS